MTSFKDGFCYAAIDANFPEYIKIGCTEDISKRFQSDPHMSIFFCCGDEIAEHPKRGGDGGDTYSEGRLEQLVLDFLADIGLVAFPDFKSTLAYGEDRTGYPKGASEYVRMDRATILRHVEDADRETRAFLLKMVEEWYHTQLSPDDGDPDAITLDDLEASYDEECRPAARLQVHFDEPKMDYDDND